MRLRMSTLKDRIEEIQTTLGWSNQKTADIAGVSRSAVAQWKGQGSKIIHSISRVDVAENLAKASGFNARWIALGEGPKGNISNRAKLEWPFNMIDMGKVCQLSDVEKGKLEGGLLLLAAQLGIDIKNNLSGDGTDK